MAAALGRCMPRAPRRVSARAGWRGRGLQVERAVILLARLARGRAARQQRHGRHLGQVMAVRTVTNRERAALAGEVQQSTDCMPAVHVPPGA